MPNSNTNPDSNQYSVQVTAGLIQPALVTTKTLHFPVTGVRTPSSPLYISIHNPSDSPTHVRCILAPANDTQIGSHFRKIGNDTKIGNKTMMENVYISPDEEPYFEDSTLSMPLSRIAPVTQSLP